MSDFTLVDPKGWEYDLHSVYSAFIGHFQVNNISWYERSWGHLFSSFDQFLAFSWPVITITDTWTNKPHIVTRLTSIGAFLKMIKTRYGETLQQAPNILMVSPFENGNRQLRNVSDHASYNKLYSTLPAVFLTALKVRVKAGEYKAIRELWDSKDKTFLAIDFEWSERNEKSCLEWGYAAVKCGHLNDLGHWPPDPENYRRGHFIIEEYVDKAINRYCPTYPWDYAFGDSQILSKSKLPEVIQAVISSLASPDSSTTPNALVLVGHGISGDLARLEEMKIKLPHNVLVVDTAVFERVLHSTGRRGLMINPHSPNHPRTPGATLSLENLLRSFLTNPMPSSPNSNGSNSNSNSNNNSPTSRPPAPAPPTPPLVLPNIRFHNAGNDAFMCLFALQMLLDPLHTKSPTVKRGRIGRRSSGGVTSPTPKPTPVSAASAGAYSSPMMSTPAAFPRHSVAFTGPTTMMATMPYRTELSLPANSYDLAAEFGQMRTTATTTTTTAATQMPMRMSLGMTVVRDADDSTRRMPGRGRRKSGGYGR